MARFVALSGPPDLVSTAATPLANAVLGCGRKFSVESLTARNDSRVVVVSVGKSESVGRHVELPLLVAADARLDNLSDLTRRSGLPEDTAVPCAILETYLHFGDGFERQLEGEFSFAIWDGRKDRWYCARDRFGIKPAYYASDMESFACASAPAGLSRLPWVPNVPNLQMGLGVLAGFYLDEHASLYQEVNRIPPSHALVHSAGKNQLARYWRLDPFKAIERGDLAFGDEWLELFRQAVRKRSLNAAPSSVSLSGGLDSSSVYAALDECRSGSQSAISAVFDHTPILDERPFVRAVAGEHQNRLHWTYPESITSPEHVRAAMAVLEEPHLLEFYQIPWSVFETAAAINTHTLWTGYNGDSVISYGWGWAHELAKDFRFRELYRELRCSARPPSALLRLVRSLLSSYQPRHLMRARAYYRSRLGRLHRERSFSLTRTGQRTIRFSERLSNDTWANPSRIRSSREWHAASLEDMRADCSFLVMERLGHHFGVETTHPFMDRELVEFCVALPVEEKRKSGHSRHILREAGKSLLPFSVRNRKSKAIFTPYLDWAFSRCFEMADLHQIHQSYPELRENLVSPSKFLRCPAPVGKGSLNVWPFHRWCHATLLVWYDWVKQGGASNHLSCKDEI